MQKLHENPQKFYKPSQRPSGHAIGDKFATDNGGAIPSNLLQIPNTESNSLYIRRCKFVGTAVHPARFPLKLPDFFIRFLTDEGDTVLDIFAGSNTTGAAAELLKRKWLAFEQRRDYLAASVFRFLAPEIDFPQIAEYYQKLCASGGGVHVETKLNQQLELPFD
jgi:site-specific DNA-methyltransferase (cytosine-N4-specific)